MTWPTYKFLWKRKSAAVESIGRKSISNFRGIKLFPFPPPPFHVRLRVIFQDSSAISGFCSRSELRDGRVRVAMPAEKLILSYIVKGFHRESCFLVREKCFQGRSLTPEGRPLHPERSEGCNRDPRGVKDRPRIHFCLTKKQLPRWNPFMI